MTVADAIYVPDYARGTRADVAWAAGVFEGEGCIRVRDPYVSIVVSMTDKDVIERLPRILGTGTIRENHRHDVNCQLQWVWEASTREDVRRILVEFMPFLGRRRKKKAWEALEVIGRALAARAPRDCANCGGEFKPATHGPVSKFCSPRCTTAARRRARAS